MTAAPIRVVVVTVSDRSWRGERPDATGPALQARIAALGWQLVDARLLPDEPGDLAAFLSTAADSGTTDLILTAGGTGFSARDQTPEATLAVIERSAPGIPEAIRADSLRFTPHGMLSRGAAGIRKKTLIVNLSGSPKAAVEQLDVIAAALPHAVALLRETGGDQH